MISLLNIFEIVAPVFILAAVGYIWVKFGFEYRVEFVTQFAMAITLPCLVFTALMKTEFQPYYFGNLLMAAILGYFSLATLAFVFVKIFKLGQRTYLMPLISGNTGNLGLPLCLFAFGDSGFGYAIIVFSVTSIVAFTIGVWVVAGGGSLKQLLKEPLVASTVFGLIFMWQGCETPSFLTNSLG